MTKEDQAAYSLEDISAPGCAGFKLYIGRDDEHHGAWLCTLSDFDKDGERTRETIIDALNKQKRIKELEDSLEAMRNISAAKTKAWMKQDKLIMELEAENNKARELIDDLIQAALNDCVESREWSEVEERARLFLITKSEEGKDD